MPEITKTKNQKPKTKNQIVWLLLASVVVAVYFFGLTIPLLGPDEPRYAQIAREMFERGDWITPKLGGFDWFEKPALLYWLQIVSYNIFGVTEFAARFGSALFGLGTIFSLWILGRSLVAEFTEKDREFKDKKTHLSCSVNSTAKKDFANWLALIAASSIGLIAFSRGATFDIILTFPITASLVGFFIFDQSKEKSLTTYHLPLIIFYFFIGVALLAKGLVGIIFPLAIVTFYYLLSWKFPPRAFIFSLFWGTILSLLVAAVWYLPMYQTNGWKFIDEFFIRHHFQRFASDKYKHWQPFWFFWLILPLMTLPWLPFFLASIWDFIKVQSSKFKVQNSKFKILQNSQLSTFAVAWLLVPLVFFTFSGSKLPGYILPALPAALVLTAEYVYRFVQKSAKKKIILQIAALTTFAVAVILLQFVVPKYALQDSVKGLIEAANKNGYTSEKIVNLYTVSHNLEFYAPDRLVRNGDGTQKRYDDFSILAAEAKNRADGKILVLVPRKDLANILADKSPIEKVVLGGNDEQSIVLLNAK